MLFETFYLNKFNDMSKYIHIYSDLESHSFLKDMSLHMGYTICKRTNATYGKTNIFVCVRERNKIYMFKKRQKHIIY